MRQLPVLLGLTFVWPAAAWAQSCTESVDLLRSQPVVRCDSNPTPAQIAAARARQRDPWGHVEARARERDPWARAEARARQRDPWGTAEQRAQARLARIRQRARADACLPPRTSPDPWAQAEARSRRELPRAIPCDTGRRQQPTTVVVTGRRTVDARTGVIVDAFDTGRRPDPFCSTSTGRSTQPRHAIDTGRTLPRAATPTADDDARALLRALERGDWAAACRLAASFAEAPRARQLAVQASFYALYPSPTLLREARHELGRHCQEEAGLVSLLRMLGVTRDS